MAMRRRKKTKRKTSSKKKLTVTQKWNQLKRQTERAGMKVMEKNRKIVVSRRSRKKR